jgi:hypothetical protein
MGFELQKARKLVFMLQSIAPELDISMDSNRLRAVTGQGRPMTVLEGRMRVEEPEGVFGAVESEALDGAGRMLDYTDVIAMPSLWATGLQLATIADVAGLARLDRKAFMSNPDAFLQAPAGVDAEIAWIELPHVSYALDCAWQSHVNAEQVRSIRTAAVRKIFEESRISRNVAA